MNIHTSYNANFQQRRDSRVLCYFPAVTAKLVQCEIAKYNWGEVGKPINVETVIQICTRLGRVGCQWNQACFQKWATNAKSWCAAMMKFVYKMAACLRLSKIHIRGSLNTTMPVTASFPACEIRLEVLPKISSSGIWGIHMGDSLKEGAFGC